MKGHKIHHGPHKDSAHSSHVSKKHVHNAKHDGHVIHHELHVHKKRGGMVEEGKDVKEPSPSEVYAGKGSKVVSEAEKKKKGGKVCRADGGKIQGEYSRPRLDRPGRKRGGRIGSDTSPLSSAARMSTPAGRYVDKEND